MSANGTCQLNGPAGPFGQRGVEDVVLERLAILGLIGVRLFLGFDIDRGAVVGGADRAGEERPVVARIVPGKAAIVAGVLPEADRELDRLDRSWAVQHNRLAVGFDLLAAPRPQIRVPERVRVAKGVRQCLADRMALGLELLAGLAPFLPGFRIFFRPIADFVPPRGAVGDLQADDRVGNGKPLLAVIGDRLGGFVIAALCFADLLGDVADIGDTLGVELRPIVDRADDVGTGAGRDGRK